MRRFRTGRASSWLVTTILATSIGTPVLAQTAAPDATKPATAEAATSAPETPPTWISGIKFGAQLEGGATINPMSPATSNNFGQLFTDKANTALLNQVLLSVQRLPDPKATDYDFGFQFQALYGSDARYTQFMGMFNSTFASRYQLSIPNANVQAHLPWLTEGGLDVKVGLYPTPVGYEVIDPLVNPFYSHSYIFNFGLPLVAAGGQAILHVNDTLDIYAGADTGMNTTFGSGDNNGAAAGMAGLGLNNLLDGKLTILALTHFGPENPTRTVPGANGAFRYENDIVVTYKATDKLTLVTDFNLIRDDKFKANGFGVAQYASYTLSDTVALNARAEIYRDDNGFFVAAFPGNHDFINAQLGYPSGIVGAGPATYSEFTLGLTWAPSLPMPGLATFKVRPEVRYDQTLTTTNAYNNFSNRGQFTFAADAIIGF